MLILWRRVFKNGCEIVERMLRKISERPVRDLVDI